MTRLEIYPNPVKDDLEFKIVLAKPGYLEVNIFNLEGLEVKKLIKGWRDFGVYYISTNVRDLNPNIYFLQFKTQDLVITEKFIIIR